MKALKRILKGIKNMLLFSIGMLLLLLCLTLPFMAAEWFGSFAGTVIAVMAWDFGGGA